MNELKTTDSGVYFALSVNSNLTEQATYYKTTIANKWDKMAILEQYSACNDAIGKHIALCPDYAFCPALIGQNDKMIFLFQFVNILDELIDYEDIQSLMPGFSFKQIGGAIAFLRKLAQFNLSDIDIDAFIDSEDMADEALLSGLHSALSIRREANVVLNIS